MPHHLHRYLLASLLAIISTGCCNGAHRQHKHELTPSLASNAVGQKVADTYTAAINTNKIDAILAELSDDVVFLPPNDAALVGKAAIQKWGTSFLSAVAFNEVQTAEETRLFGDWMFVRYSYKQTITPRAGGAAMNDTGKGILLLHSDADGKWRVVQDAWNSDVAAGK